jgi:hypothetical protein
LPTPVKPRRLSTGSLLAIIASCLIFLLILCLITVSLGLNKRKSSSSPEEAYPAQPTEVADARTPELSEEEEFDQYESPGSDSHVYSDVEADPEMEVGFGRGTSVILSDEAELISHEFDSDDLSFTDYSDYPIEPPSAEPLGLHALDYGFSDASS